MLNNPYSNSHTYAHTITNHRYFEMKKQLSFVQATFSPLGDPMRLSDSPFFTTLI